MLSQFAKKLIFPRPQEPSFSSSTFYNFDRRNVFSENMSPLLHIPIIDPITKTWTGSSTNAYLHIYSDASYLIIFAHPNAVDIGMITEDLYYLGYFAKMHVLAFEYTGYGLTNKEPPSEESMYADAFSAYWFARSVLRVPCQRLVLVGRSIGSAVIAHLASHLPSYEEEVLLDRRNSEICGHRRLSAITSKRTNNPPRCGDVEHMRSTDGGNLQKHNDGTRCWSSGRLPDSNGIFEKHGGDSEKSTTYASSMIAEAPHAYRPCLVVLQCPFTSISACVSSLSGIPYTAKVVNFLGLNWFRTLDKIDQILSPVVFHHGTEDKLIPFVHTLDLKEKRDNASRTLVSYLHPEEGRGHNDLTSQFLIQILSDRVDADVSPCSVQFPSFFKAHPPIYGEYFSISQTENVLPLGTTPKKDEVSPSFSSSFSSTVGVWKGYPLEEELSDEKKMEKETPDHLATITVATNLNTSAETCMPALKEILTMWKRRPLRLRDFLTSFFSSTMEGKHSFGSFSSLPSSPYGSALSVLLTLSVTLFSMRCTRLWQEYIQGRSTSSGKPKATNSAKGERRRTPSRHRRGGNVRYSNREENAFPSPSHGSSASSLLHRMSSFFSSSFPSNSSPQVEVPASHHKDLEGSVSPRILSAPQIHRPSSPTNVGAGMEKVEEEADHYSSLLDVDETMHSREAFVRGCMARWGSPLGVHLTRFFDEPSRLRYVVFGSTMESSEVDPVLDFSPYIWGLSPSSYLSSSSLLKSVGRAPEDTASIMTTTAPAPSSPVTNDEKERGTERPEETHASAALYLATVAELPCTPGLMSVMKHIMSYSSYESSSSSRTAIGNGEHRTYTVDKEKENDEGKECQGLAFPLPPDTSPVSPYLPPLPTANATSTINEDNLEKAVFSSNIPCFIGKEQVSAIQTECERLVAYLSYEECVFWEKLFCDIFREGDAILCHSNTSSRTREEDFLKDPCPESQTKSDSLGAGSSTVKHEIEGKGWCKAGHGDPLLRRLSAPCQQYLQSIDNWVLRGHTASLCDRRFRWKDTTKSFVIDMETFNNSSGSRLFTTSCGDPQGLPAEDIQKQFRSEAKVQEKDKHKQREVLLHLPSHEECERMHGGKEADERASVLATDSFISFVSSQCTRNSQSSYPSSRGNGNPFEGSVQDIQDYMVQWQPLFRSGCLPRFFFPNQRNGEIRMPKIKGVPGKDITKFPGQPLIEMSTAPFKLLFDLSLKVNWDVYLTKSRASCRSSVPRRDSGWDELILFFQEHTLLHQVYQLWQTSHHHPSK